jgi:hypothetical protein
MVKNRQTNRKLNPGNSAIFNRGWAIVLVLTALIHQVVYAQKASLPFKPGEFARYNAYYNWHFIWVNGGEVDFTCDSVGYHNHPAYHIKAVGRTFKAYDLLFQVRDTFEAYAALHPFRPLYFRRVVNHGKSHSEHRYRMDYSKKKIYCYIDPSDRKPFRDTLLLKDNTFDLLSTAYNFRTFDFNTLKVGQKVPYRMLIDNEIPDLYFHYWGKENITTRSGRTFRCHKVSVYLLKGDFFNEGEYMKVWFTDDANHVPVQVETEILVGSVKAQLLEVRSLKYPLSSEIRR